MGTSATINFFTQDSLKERSKSVFVNLDGYPLSIGQRLADAIVKSFDNDDHFDIHQKAPLVNCFIAENFNSCHIVSNENNMCEYSYDVYVHRNLIKLYNHSEDTMNVWALDEFLSLHTREDWLYIQSYNIGVCDFRIKSKLEGKLSKMVGRAITWENFLENPNYHNWKEQLDFVRSIKLGSD